VSVGCDVKLVILQYGPVFTMEMAGKKFTYLTGSEASSLLFNSKNEDLNAEDVYGKLVTPVFGKGVAYDVPNDVCTISNIYAHSYLTSAKEFIKSFIIQRGMAQLL